MWSAAFGRSHSTRSHYELLSCFSFGMAFKSAASLFALASLPSLLFLGFSVPLVGYRLLLFD